MESSVLRFFLLFLLVVPCCCGSTLAGAGTLFTCNTHNHISPKYTMVDPSTYCYMKDTPAGGDRIPSLEGKHQLINDSYINRNDSVIKCARVAMTRGFKYFALSNKECLSAIDAETTYIKNGKASGSQPCPPTGEAGGMAVYKLDFDLDLMVWLEIPNFFHEWTLMFNNKSALYLEVKNATEQLFINFINSNSICGLNIAEMKYLSPRGNGSTVIANIHLPTTHVRPSEIIERILSPYQPLNITVNNVTGEANILNVFKLKGDCKYNNSHLQVKINKIGKTPEEALAFNRSQAKTFGSITTTTRLPECNVTSINYQWELGIISEDSRNRTFINLTDMANVSTWSSPPRTFNFGLSFIQLTASVLGESELTGYDYGFIKVGRGPLVAKFVEGTARDVSVNRNITLNATLSFDPNEFAGPGNYEGMTATWLCTDANDIKNDLDNPMLYNVSEYGVENLGLGGCFGQGPNRLNYSMPLAYLDNRGMSQSSSFDIHLYLVKHGILTKVVQTIKMVLAPPKFEIRCKTNCKSSVRPSSRLGLESVCLGPSCSKTVRFEWILFVDVGRRTFYGEIDYARVANLEPHLMTPMDGPTALVEENFLEPNKSHVMKLRVRTVKTVLIKDVGEDFIPYYFITNIPPILGRCNVTPTEGQALEDEFVFLCQDWEDNELPLSYELYTLYDANDTMGTLVAYGLNNSFSLNLPIGDANNNYTLWLKLLVLDALKTSTKVIMNVTSSPPDEESFGMMIDGIVSGENDTTNDLIMSGDVQKAAQYATAFTSVLQDNSSSAIDKGNKTKVRGSIITSLSSAEVNMTNGTENLIQVASVLGRVTDNPEELSLDSQVTAIGAAGNLTSLLNASTETSDDVLEVINTGTYLTSLTGNVLGGVALSYAEESSTNPTTSPPNGAKNSSAIDVTKQALNVTGSLSKVILSQKIVGERPSTMTTKSMTLSVNRQQPHLMPKNIPIQGGKFGLPNDLPFLERKVFDDSPEGEDQTVSFVDSSSTSLPFNPYRWDLDGSSKRVGSDVIGLDFRDSEGNPIDTSNFTTDIEIGIPRKPIIGAKNLTKFFVNPDTNESLVFHKFFVQYNNSAFHMRIKPEEEKKLVVYIRRGRRPSADEHDLRRIIPDFRSCLKPQACEMIEEWLDCLGYAPNNETKNATKNANFLNEIADVILKNLFFSKETVAINQSKGLCDNVPSLELVLSNKTQGNAPPCLTLLDYIRCPDPKCPDDNTTRCKVANCSVFNCSQGGNCTDDDGTFLCIDEITSTVNCTNFLTFAQCYGIPLNKSRTCSKVLKPKPFFIKYWKCLRDPYTYFFNTNETSQAGWYYAGINYSNDTQEWTDLPPTTTPPTTVPTTVPTSVSTTSSTTHKKSTTKKISTKKDDRRKRSLERSFETAIYERQFSPIKRYRRDSSNQNATENNTTETGTKPQRRCAVIEEKAAPTDPPTPAPVTPPTYSEQTSLLYTFDVSVSNCLYWNEQEETWTTEGCKVGENTTLTLIQCFCSHLTSFGGDVLVAPNPIDFDKVFAGFSNLADSGNVAVLGTVGGLFLIYFLVVLIARRADKSDAEKIPGVIVIRARGGSEHKYEVTVSTGTFGDAGTTANVSLILGGEKEESETLPLFGLKKDHSPFIRGSVNVIVACLPSSIGPLKYIKIWHDNTGESPSWQLRQVVIRDIQSDEKWYFVCNDWLAVDKGDGQVQKVIDTAGKAELVSFKNMFTARTSKNLGDGHLWISVVTRPPNNNFTRVQRLTCCLSLLFCAMITNAMFYTIGDESSDTVNFGPISLSPRQIIIGIQSSLIVVPINLLIITLFRNAKPKAKKSNNSSIAENYRKKYNDEEDQTPKKDEKQINDSGHENKGFSNDEENENNLNEKEENPDFMNRNKENEKIPEEKESGKNPVEKREKKKKKTSSGPSWPHWCVYIAYTLSILSALTAAAFVTFYSMMWGKEKSNQWLTSVMVSLIQDIFVIQPLKVVVVAILLSLILRKPPEDESVPLDEDSAELTSKDPSFGQCEPELTSSYRPPDEKTLAIARDRKQKENKMWVIVNDALFQLIFALVLFLACYGTRTAARYRVMKAVSETFPSSDKVVDSQKFWAWCDSSLLPGLYNNTWYNNWPFHDKEGFISNKKYFIVGLPRLRQARIKPEPCSATAGVPPLHRVFPLCYYEYSLSNAADTPMGSVEVKSQQRTNSTDDEPLGFDRICLEPLKFKTSSDLGTLPVLSGTTAYGGGGFVGDLGYEMSKAKEVILNLKEDDWINRETRAIFVEFVLFEPSSNIYAFVRFLFSYQPTGVILPSYRVEPLAIYGASDSLTGLVIFCQLVFVLLLLWSIISECRKIFKEKCAYFKDAWNIVELLLIGSAVGTVTIYIIKLQYTGSIIEKVQENPYGRMSFDYVALMTDVESAILAVLIFLVTIRILKQFRFNSHVRVVARCVTLVKASLIEFSIITITVMMAYAQIAMLVFGPHIYMYSNIVRAFVNEFMMLLGAGMMFDEMSSVSPVFGRFFLFMYSTTMFIILMNFFMAILNDSMEDSKEDEDTDDAIMSEFMSNYVRTSLRGIREDLQFMLRRSKGKKLKYTATFMERKESIYKDNIDFVLY